MNTRTDDVQEAMNAPIGDTKRQIDDTINPIDDINDRLTGRENGMRATCSSRR